MSDETKQFTVTVGMGDVVSALVKARIHAAYCEYKLEPPRASNQKARVLQACTCWVEATTLRVIVNG